MPTPDVGAAVIVPVLLAALSLLGLVLKWLIQRETNTDSRTLQRITDLEAELAELRVRQSEERHLKHNALNRSAGLAMTVRLLMASARKCTCGELTQVLELVDRTGVAKGVERGHRQ